MAENHPCPLLLCQSRGVIVPVTASRLKALCQISATWRWPPVLTAFVFLLLLLLLLCWALDKTQLNDVAQIHSRYGETTTQLVLSAVVTCSWPLACPDHGLPESLLRIGALTQVHCLGFCGHNSDTSTECLTEYLEIGWECENVWDVLCLRRPVTGGHKSGCLRWQSFILRCDKGFECETQWLPPPPQGHILCEVPPGSSCS